MFGISLWELLILMVVVLLVFGPDRLPDAARTLGRLLSTLRSSTDSVRREIYNAVHMPAETFGREIDGVRRDLQAVTSGLKEPFLGDDPLCPDYKRPETDGGAAVETDSGGAAAKTGPEAGSSTAKDPEAVPAAEGEQVESDE